MTLTLTEEEQSKDRFFQELARVAEEMIEAHGTEFASGALILCAQWVAQHRIGRPPEAVQ